MEYLFYNCKSLIFLPDISKWDIHNVTNISYLFYNCSSLNSIPNISKWKTFNIININSLFEGCTSLTYLPDISLWETNNLKSADFLFKNCKNLIITPDITKWNLFNIKNINNIYEGYHTNFSNDSLNINSGGSSQNFLLPLSADSQDLLNSLDFNLNSNSSSEENISNDFYANFYG